MSKKAVAVPAQEPLGRSLLAGLIAWLIPGGGHLLLGRWQRAAAFFVLVLATLALGCQLQGRLPWTFSGSPLPILATFAAMGNGAAFFGLRFAVGYQGVIEAQGFEYGSAFILTAGLMNLLLVLDAWDIARGKKD